MNRKKTKNMIFDFTKDDQFMIILLLDNVNIEIINDFKLLGTWIKSDLHWNKKTTFFTKWAYEECNYCTRQSNLQRAR